METRTKLILGGVAIGLFVFSKRAPGGGPLTVANTADLSALNPVAKQAIGAFLAKLDSMGLPFRVTETFRTSARQAQLFAQGRTAPGPVVTELDGRPGNESRHQSGNAADLALDLKRWNVNTLGPKPINFLDLGINKGELDIQFLKPGSTKDNNTARSLVRPNVLAVWKAMGREAQANGLRWLGTGSVVDRITGLAFDAPHVEIPG